MNIIPIVKLGAGLLTSFGAGAVVSNAIKATTPDTLKKTSKILILVGGTVLAAAAGDLAANYVEDSIQGVYDGVRAAKKKVVVVDTDGVAEAAQEFKDAGENLAQETKKAAKKVIDEVSPEDKPETSTS